MTTSSSRHTAATISDWYKGYIDIPGRAKVVSNEEILENKDCSLSVSLYATLYKDNGNYESVTKLIPEWESCSDTVHKELNNLISLLS